MVWLRFRHVDAEGRLRESQTKVRAGNYNWEHRDWLFDILEATTDDPE